MSSSLRHEPGSFDELLVEQLRAAPWIVISALLHLMLGVLLFLFSGPEVEAPPPPTLRAMMDEITEDEPTEIEEPIKPETTEVEVETVDVPLPTETPVEETTDEPADDSEVWSEDSAAADVDARDMADASPIGIGGGPAGALGPRGRGKGRGPGGPGGALNRARDRALDWLADHQSLEGYWDADGFMKRGDPKRGPLADGAGEPLHDVGVTGLAMLAFLGAGETHQAGPFRVNLRRALRWLQKRQDAEGCFAIRTASRFTYDHAVATTAIVEAYAMTGSPVLRETAQRALAFCLRCQNPYGGWRYGEADGEVDASVTGWMIMALKAGQMAKLDVDAKALAWGIDALEKLTDAETGRCGYMQRGSAVVREPELIEAFPASESEALTAVAVLARVFGGRDPAKDALIRKGADLLGERLPNWDESRGSIDMYYWYYGSLAAFQVGGPLWRQWRRAMEEAVVESQRGLGAQGRRDNFTGSWDPVGPWGKAGGRVYATALMTLCLEVYYRYGRVFGAR
jgi:Squalene-hopene cyclase C-terminal domain